jgi:hypothetical protein
VESGTGDFWMTDGASLTGKDGTRVTGPAGKAMKIDRFGKGPSENVVGFRDLYTIFPESKLPTEFLGSICP